MAQQGGVDPAVLRAIVTLDFARMPEDVALPVRFTEATRRAAPRLISCKKRSCATSAGAG
jgi:hypothetical protein